MSGESAARLLGVAVLLPAAGALVLLWMSRKLLRGDASARYPAAAGFVGGFVIGYLLLTDWDEWLPTRHWHWMLYLALAAGVIGPIGNANGVALAERRMLILLLAVTSAWFLVPTWSSLDPPRVFWLLALSGLLFLLAVGLDPLPQRIGSRPVLLSMCAAALAVTIMVGLCVSVTYAGLAAVASASLAGICIEAIVRRVKSWRSRLIGSDRSTISEVGPSEAGLLKPALKNGLSEVELGVRCLLPVFTVVVGGVAFVGCVEPERPLYGLLLLPAAPLGLWLSSIGRLKDCSGPTAVAVQTGTVVVPLLAAATQVYFAS